jgi:hypothetical protein
MGVGLIEYLAFRLQSPPAAACSIAEILWPSVAYAAQGAPDSFALDKPVQRLCGIMGIVERRSLYKQCAGTQQSSHSLPDLIVPKGEGTGADLHDGLGLQASQNYLSGC